MERQQQGFFSPSLLVAIVAVLGVRYLLQSTPPSGTSNHSPGATGADAQDPTPDPVHVPPRQPGRRETWFLSFGSAGYATSIDRITREAHEVPSKNRRFGITMTCPLCIRHAIPCPHPHPQMGVFHRVRVADERVLRADENFWRLHGEFIASNPRGFGYWVWKSFLINRTLHELQVWYFDECVCMYV